MKIAAIVLALCLLVSCAVADTIDLSKMTFAELQALQQRVNAEIASRPEWKEVEVPAGMWRIGEDIPAGEYCISRASEKYVGNVTVWGKTARDFEAGGGWLFGQTLSDSKPVIGRIELKAGTLIELDIPVIFSPVKGLGF